MLLTKCNQRISPLHTLLSVNKRGVSQMWLWWIRNQNRSLVRTFNTEVQMKMFAVLTTDLARIRLSLDSGDFTRCNDEILPLHTEFQEDRIVSLRISGLHVNALKTRSARPLVMRITRNRAVTLHFHAQNTHNHLNQCAKHAPEITISAPKTDHDKYKC